MDESIEERIEELVKEEISIISYDPSWVQLFREEEAFLRARLPKNLIKRIEHFGSTAVPGLSAKPIIDILVEVTSLEETKKQIVPILQAEGYEYFWRPTIGDAPPYYAWFIKRDKNGQRSHHIHMVEKDSDLWDRLFFRDYLREFPEIADQYEKLKHTISEKHPNNRILYTEKKSSFILSITKKAKVYYLK